MDKTDSDDYSTDDNRKRKLDEKEKEDGFTRSKRMQRTPTKVSGSKDDKLDMILKMMQELKTDLTTQIQQIGTEQKAYIEEVKQLKAENENLKRENEEIKKELTEIKNNMEWIDKEKRKNNVVVYGLKIDTKDTEVLKNEMQNFIKDHLGVEIQIKQAYKLGEETCLIGLHNEQDKIKIMENKKKLRNNKDDKIYINNDLTKMEREIQKQIRKKAQEERNNGNQVKIGYNKVVVNGEEWRWSVAQRKLEITKPKN